MIGQAFVTCPTNRSSQTYRQWKPCGFPRRATLPRKVHLFFKKKKSGQCQAGKNKPGNTRKIRHWIPEGFRGSWNSADHTSLVLWCLMTKFCCWLAMWPTFLQVQNPLPGDPSLTPKQPPAFLSCCPHLWIVRVWWQDPLWALSVVLPIAVPSPSPVLAKQQAVSKCV